MEVQQLRIGGEGRLEVWARRFLVLAVGLLPIFIIPVQWFPFQLTKIALFAVLIALSTLLFAVHTWRNRMILVSRSKMILVAFGLVGAYAVATILSQNRMISLFGQGTEVDTLFFIALAVLVFLIASSVLRAREHFTSFFLVLLASSGFAALFQCAQLISKGHLLSVLSTSSSNLVGGWNDFGALMGLFVAVSVVVADIGRPRGKMVIIPVLLLIVGLFLLGTVNFVTVWLLLLAVAAITIAATVFRNRAGDVLAVPLHQRLPYASVLVVVVSGVFLIWGATLNAKLSNYFAIQELEIRPSAQTTLEIMRGTYSQSTLTTFFGSGPNTFTEQWSLHKPVDVNSSQFWNTDFPSGVGAIPTAFVTTGLFGGLLWIAFIVLLALAVLRHTFVGVQDQFLRMASLASATGALFLFAVAFLYAPSQVSILLAFILAGVFLATERLAGTNEWEYTFADGRVARKFVAVMVILAVLTTSVYLAYIALNRFVTSLYVGRAIVASNADDINGVIANANRALAIHRDDKTLRLVASARLAEAQKISASTEGNEADRAAAFQTALQIAIDSALAATVVNPNDYGNWLALGQIYEALMPLEVDGAYQSAQAAYVQAIRRSPRNPSLYLALARLEASAGNEQNARDAAAQALSLKQNYTDAIMFIAQLEIAKKNLDGAIQAVQAAVLTAENNAGLWFELGLLQYNKPNDEAAAQAFQQAITLAPTYANAQYFLGLVYARNGKAADAFGIFSELAKANPDNAEIKTILENLRAGRPALQGVEAGDNPTERTTAPIAQ